MNQVESYTRLYTDLDNADVSEVGGKNASLGEMTQRLADAGIHVPEGFATARGLRPDALVLDLAGFRERARSRRGGVKSWLMDQGEMAGIGNVYTDEILFQARIHPARAVAKLDDATLKTLHQSLRRVLRQAIEAHADPDAMPRNFLLPHRRAEGRCPRCGEPVATTRVGGRTAYYCPRCQTG